MIRNKAYLLCLLFAFVKLSSSSNNRSSWVRSLDNLSSRKSSICGKKVEISQERPESSQDYIDIYLEDPTAYVGCGNGFEYEHEEVSYTPQQEQSVREWLKEQESIRTSTN